MKSKPSSNTRIMGRRAALVLLPMLALLVCDSLIAPHFRLAYNESDSLPGTLFLVKTGVLPACGSETGEYVQFRMRKDARWYSGNLLLKVAKGCPGDMIRIVDRHIYVNDWDAGVVAPTLGDGTPMPTIRPGVIPDGHYYMWASHPSSFDSRYAEFNLISQRQIVGAASRIF